VDPENAAGMTAKLLCTPDEGRAHLKERTARRLRFKRDFMTPVKSNRTVISRAQWLDACRPSFLGRTKAEEGVG
jgi:hypothetical protein